MNSKKYQMSINPLKHALNQAGWDSQTVKISGELHEKFTKNNYSWLTPRSVIEYPFVPNDARQLASNKTLSSRYVNELGGNIPESIEVSKEDSLETAENLLIRYRTVIVKPRSGRDSQGLSLDISTFQELTSALEKAWHYSDTALVQEMVSGKEYRFTVLNNKVVSILERQPAQLIGDGKKTLSQLLKNENDFRLSMTDSALEYIQLSLHSDQDHDAVPKKDQVKRLNKSVSMSNGASVYERLPDVHSFYISFVKTLARHMKTDFIAVDLLIDDISSLGNSENWSFLECNTGPSLHYYSSIRNSCDHPMISKLVERIDELAA